MLNRVCAALLLALVACHKPPDSPGSSESAATTADAGAVDPDEVRPVYAGEVPVNPLASRLCDALYAAPAEKLATCCGTKPQPSLAGECRRVVSLALAGKQVVLDAARLGTCETALAASTASCDRAGNETAPLPEECEDLFGGSLGAGAVCRSALECARGLTCAGLGPTEPGRCTPPATANAPCHPVVDPLAAMARQRTTQHPSCEGYCNRTRCADVVALGAACAFQDPCGRENHCGDGKCQAGPRALVGESCTAGGCERDAVCVGGKCERQRASGLCTQDADCLGGCRMRDGGRACGPRCPEAFVAPISTGHAAPPLAPAGVRKH